MLIRFFRYSFIIQYIALILIGVALWVPAFLDPQPLPLHGSTAAPVYLLIERVFPGLLWLAPLLGLLLVLAVALILNSIFIYHDLVPKNTLLPSLLFLLFMSSDPSALTLYPVLLVMLPMAYYAHLLYKLYEESQNLNIVLGLGLLSALTSMLYPPLMLFLLFTWIAILVYRTFHWREWLVALIGFVLPYLYLGIYYFWMDQLVAVGESYLQYFRELLVFKASVDLLQLPVWGIFLVLILLPAVFRVSSTLGGYNIAFRRRMAATIWMAIFSLLTVVARGEISFNTLLYLPATVILAHHYSSIKKPVVSEIILMLYLIAIGAHNYLSVLS